MSYHRANRGYPGIGALELTGAGGFPANANDVPISPGFIADASGQRWTRADIFAIPTKISAAASGSSGPSTISNVGSGLAALLSALAPKPVQPIQQMPLMPIQQGMSTTTKIALAGGAALVLVLLATR